jgi:triacylglycerol lipase
MRLMLSFVQKILTLLGVLWALVWAGVCGLLGHWVWAPLGAVLPLLGYGVTLALELWAVARVHGNDPAPRPRLGQLIGAWWRELRTGPRVFCWQQPFRSQAVPDFLPAGHRGPGLLLVHGFVCNRGFWNRWLVKLRARGTPFVAVSLEPVLGSIGQYIHTIEQAVRQLELATGQPPVVVAHSMGGLAVRAWLAHCGERGLGRVRHVVTVASPHHGTWMARWGQSPNAREMRQGSAFIAALQPHEGPALRARFTCFYSHCDNIVFPASTGSLPGADNRHLEGAAHVQMIDHPAVLAEVLARLS